MNITHKTCTKCKQHLSIENFAKKKHTKDGYRYWCRECKKKADAIYKKNNPEKCKGYTQTDKYKANRKIYRESHIEQYRIRKKLRNYVYKGKIEKPTRCSFCNKEKEVIEGHHPDYSKPLDVIWLCIECHKALHKALRSKI